MKNANKKNILKLLSSKQVKQFLLFSGLAFLFLILTKLSESYTRDIDVKINIVNIPESNSLSITDSVIKVKAKSTGYSFFPYFFKKPTLTLDAATDFSVVKNEYQWIANLNSYNVEELLGKDINVVSIKPDTVFFEFQKMSTKRVPVKLNSNLSYAIGFDSFNLPKLKPDSVTVIGSEKLVNTINFIETAPLEQSKINNTITKALKLSKDELTNDIKLSHDVINVTINVEKFTEGVVDVPIQVINIPEGVKVNYFPKSLPVYYYTRLANYKSVQDSDFKIISDYNTFVSSDNGKLNVVLDDIASNVKSAKIKQNTINIIIEQ